MPTISQRRAKAEADKPPSRWETLGKAFEFIQKLFAFGGAVVGGLAVLYLLTIGQKQTIVALVHE